MNQVFSQIHVRVAYLFFVSVIALFCAYTHSFSVLGKICEGWNCSKIGDIAPLIMFTLLVGLDPTHGHLVYLLIYLVYL